MTEELYGPNDDLGRDKIESMIRDEATEEELALRKVRDIKTCSETLYRDAEFLDFQEAMDNISQAEINQLLYELRNRYYADLGQTIAGIFQRHCERVAEQEYRE